MEAFFSGMLTMGLVIAGLFFLRFWKRTGDVLFAAFALAFWLLAFNEGLIGAPRGTAVDHWLAFLPRLAAFAVLILAILIKNLAGSGKGPRS